MIANYYTLFHLTKELSAGFSGRTIEQMFTQHRGELVLQCTSTPAVIVVGCEASRNYMYERKSFARARRNTAALFQETFGQKIEGIYLHPTDRQIEIALQDDHTLLVQLFGSNANVVLSSGDGTVVSTFLKKPEVRDGKVDGGILPRKAVSPEDVQRIIAEAGQVPARVALKKAFPLFGSVLVLELLMRSGVDGSRTVGSLSEKEILRMLDTASRLKDDLLSAPSPRVYFRETAPVQFSIIPLTQFENCRFEEFRSISDAIQVCQAGMRQEKSFSEEKELIAKILRRELEQTDRTVRKLADEGELLQHAGTYEKNGKLLMGHLYLVQKGDTSVLVENIIDGTNDIVEIALDTHLSPAKNAERYFERARKSRHTAEEQKNRRLDLIQRKEILAHLQDLLEESTSAEDLDRYVEENRAALAPFGIRSGKKKEGEKHATPPFRIFTVAGGFQVWAGKSGENNDLLSTRHTAKNDLWFHARGVGGSHVVLKAGTGKGEISTQALQQAAAIAAYYSKMKNSKFVSVTMCEGKYVRKPKGAPAGTVTVEREETLLAEPGLPQ